MSSKKHHSSLIRTSLIALLLNGCGITAQPYLLSKLLTPALHAFSWMFADGGSGPGINFDSTKDGKTITVTNLNGVLYATWREPNSSVDQIRVARYNGGSSWTFIDGGGTTGINMSSADYAASPTITNDGTNLYVGWHESASGHYQAMAKKWDGTTWTPLTGTATGMNASTSVDAINIRIFYLAGNLYASWFENNFQRVAQYSTGTTWTLIDGSGLNHGSATFSWQGALATDGTYLYATWLEHAGSGPDQLRMAKRVAGVWTYIDGDGVNGFNLNPAASASGPCLTYFNNTFVSVWAEAGTMHASSYAGGVWTSVDQGSLNVTPGLTASSNNFNETALLNNKLYLIWYEQAPGLAAYQVRVAEYDGTSFRNIDGANPAIGLDYVAADATGYQPAIAVYNGGLMAMWSEISINGKYQIRAKFGI